MPIFKAEQKLIFYAHIPKCGGTTVEDYLTKRFGRPAFFDPNHLIRPNPWTKTSPQHIDKKSLSCLFPPNFFDLSFAVVRHPISRMISSYIFQRDRVKSITSNKSFTVWLKEMEANIRNDTAILDNHLRKQTDFIPEGSVIFKLENGLEKIIPFLDKNLGNSDPKITLEHKQKSFAQDKIIPSKEDIILIEELYVNDYKILGYSFTEHLEK